MKLIALIIATALAAFPAAALAMSIDQLDAPTNLTARVLDHSIDAVVQDHQSDHNGAGVVIFPGSNAEEVANNHSGTEHKIKRSMKAVQHHCVAMQSWHKLAAGGCSFDPNN